jgi:hypothetical protein
MIDWGAGSLNRCQLSPSHLQPFRAHVVTQITSPYLRFGQAQRRRRAY